LDYFQPQDLKTSHLRQGYGGQAGPQDLYCVDRVSVIGKLVEPVRFGWSGPVAGCEATLMLIVPVIVLPECAPLNMTV
jgi:hypothetical protein